jgi:hypothetical protein
MKATDEKSRIRIRNPVYTDPRVRIPRLKMSRIRNTEFDLIANLFFSLGSVKELARIDSELAAVQKQLKTLETRQRALERQRTQLLERLQQAEADRHTEYK